MPRVNIYIRKDDWDKWQQIENKPEWLHKHLSADGIYNYTKPRVWKNTDKSSGFDELKNIVDDRTLTATYGKIQNILGQEVCQHFQPKGNCLQKGCK